jgi:hypothetical protein
MSAAVLSAPPDRPLELEAGPFHENFGRRAYPVKHNLAGHPLFDIGRLLALARFLPPDRVEYNGGDLPIGIDPTLTPRTGLSPEETIRRIAECKSWMVLKNVERDPEYGALLNECLRDVEAQGHADARLIDHREAFIFLSSPGAVTPYHMDPEWNFLLQIRGKKFMTVFPADDRSLLSELELERFYSGAHRNLVYKDEYASRGRLFEMGPGDGVHVPVTAPHWVKVGPEVSVSFSITFQTRVSERRGIIYRCNHFLRKRGMSPPPVGTSPWRDAVKYQGYRVIRRIRRILGQKPE